MKGRTCSDDKNPSLVSDSCELKLLEDFPPSLPICVDLDGTFIQTDVLWVSLGAYLRRYPWCFLHVLLWWIGKGRAFLKYKLAEAVDVDVASLPLNEAVHQFILACRAKKHPCYLVTAAAEKYGRAIAQAYPLFDDVMTSTPALNLRADRKAAALVHRFGENAYAYVGNSVHDLPVWRQANRVIAVGNTPKKVLKKAAQFHKPMLLLS